MMPIVHAWLRFVVGTCRSRIGLQLEIVALRHQLAVYQRTIRRPQVRPSDRIFWAWLARHWGRWRAALVFVQPATVLAWQRRRFRDHWARLSRRTTPGRPAVSPELRRLIRDLSTANPRSGSPRILGELRKLGIAVAKSTVEKYRVRPRRPSDPTWRAFLQNHASELVALDFFTVSTVSFKVLFVLVILAHVRRRVLHFNVTEHPTAQWTAQHLGAAFPWEAAPRALLRDRDGVYGETFQQRVAGLGLAQVLTAPRSPWQHPFAEHLIGGVRRECLDHAIVCSEGPLRRVLAQCFRCYHRWRTHLSLAMDAPDRRTAQPPEQGAVVEVPEVGRLHHHYERRAA